MNKLALDYVKPALLLVDIQKGLDELSYFGGARNNPEAERNASLLLKSWRDSVLPIIHVQHSSQNSSSPLHRSHPGFEIKDEVTPMDGEVIIIKNVNSAFINTKLNDLLHQSSIKTVVIVGLTTNHCVSSTARMSSDLGFDTIVVSDATATFDRKYEDEIIDADLMHRSELAALEAEFAQILTTAEVIRMLNLNQKK